MPRTHTLRPTRCTVHGVFSPDLPPVITADSGDEIRLATLDAWWGLEPHTAEYSPRKTLLPPELATGHALTGPIAVRDLAPGEVLQIDFLEITPARHGFTECGGVPWPHYERLGVSDGPPRMLLWSIDPDARTATTTNTAVPRTVPIAPFMGVVGMPPATPGTHSTTPPRVTGGNLDCTLLTAGSSLLLPVAVPGGLLSLGDGHAAQGDGELSNNGIECAMDSVRIRLTRRPDLFLTTPLVHTAAGDWATLGLGATLEEATYRAANAMLDLLCLQLNCPRTEALGLMSASVNFRITQLVNGTLGVHALWTPPADHP